MRTRRINTQDDMTWNCCGKRLSWEIRVVSVLSSLMNNSCFKILFQRKRQCHIPNYLKNGDDQIFFLLLL